MRTEAAVIGAGPAGLIAAEAIARHGFSVEVFEEHERVGYPVHCAGMISVEGFKRLGFMAEPRFHQNTVYGGRVFSADGSCITIRDKKPRAYIIDRGSFDFFLADDALDRGVTINTGKRVDEILLEKEQSTLKVGETMVTPMVTVDAEGALGRLLSRSGIETGQTGVINGFNVEVDVDVDEPDMVEVWFNQEHAKGFFTWVIPLNESRIRCGLGTSRKNGVETLKRFIEKRFQVEAPEDIRGGLICAGGPVSRTVYDGMLLVGDVAGQVKPSTGGGLIIGGLCAGLAGEAVVKALEGDNAHALRNYEEEWRKRYGSELRAMLYARRLLNGLDDERLNRVFHAFIEEGLEEKLNALVMEGDMDMQAGVMRKALTDPAILGSLVRSVGRVALGEILSVLGL